MTLSKDIRGGLNALLLITAAAMTLARPAWADDRQPAALTDREMDAVTAGHDGSYGVDIALNLAATAVGPTATTETSGAIQVGSAYVWQVKAGPYGNIIPVGNSPARIAFGGGEARAEGAEPNCAAKIALVGDFAYVNQTSSAVMTPTAAICNCAALAISFVPH